jgi:hypothetical protein
MIEHVPDIIAVKQHLSELKEQGLIKEWEIPYEQILTRLTAAIFFLTPAAESSLVQVWKELERHKRLHYRPNYENTLSRLLWRVEFNKDPLPGE